MEQQTGVFLDHHQKLKTLILKRVNTKQLFMLLSVSLFSLVFSSSNCPSFLQPFNSFISTSFLFRLLTHTVDKNCIFLICNGILVFLAKSSGLIKGSRFRSNGSYKASPRQAEPLPQYCTYADERLPVDLRGSVEEGNKGNGYLTEDHEVSKEEEETCALMGGEEKLVGEHETRGASPEEEGGFHWAVYDLGYDQIEEREREEEEEEEEEEELSGSKILSTEELNKKFDEFIRRMKEEIRIEDQQQLVMV